MKEYFSGKRILITGHTGFKGRWLTSWLSFWGAEVFGLSLLSQGIKHSLEFGALSEDRSFDIDILDKEALKSFLDEIKPQIIFHMAAQSLVLKSFTKPFETFQTNTVGTLNLLENLRELNFQTNVIIVTSDKCYRNHDYNRMSEDSPLGGDDPYSASKAGAEIIFHSYANLLKDSNVQAISVRAGNVIGGGDWNENRLVPDFIKAWDQNQKLFVRNYNGQRPWQHVLDCLNAYLLSAYHLERRPELHGESFNFAPLNQSIEVRKVIEILKQEFPEVILHSEANTGTYEKKALLLDTSKARSLISWQEKLESVEAIRLTSFWYKEYFKNPDKANQITINQLEEYLSL
ncbi:MAG: CDP-glucose 4,6-dehydratase [Halobacteriovoraceae bacterium]|nr:CDP-glucose 4,6-dehydratase [Halobacteriovoraceae bacterium]|tara:strand:- start:744 stop:1781 length:1038 start_codon:yes stop_codon:yes gene_type:complete